VLTLSPILLTLCGLLLAALSALLAGGIAWGRFASALEQLRDDHKGLREDLKKAVDALTGVPVMRQQIQSLEIEVRDLRDAKHRMASAITKMEAEFGELRRTVDRAADAAHGLRNGAQK